MLAGLRVVDLTWGLAGALAGVVLADFGAEVLHVEPPAGDPLRAHPAWPLWGRGKRSVLLDLAAASDRAAIRRLAENADVFLTTLRPATASRLGLDYDDLAWQHPGLVYTRITGFGTRGPYAKVKGYEGVVVAKLGGMDHVAGMAPRPGPAFPSASYASFGAAQLALLGTCAALLVRARCGRGQLVEASLAQGLAAHDPWEWFLRILCEKFPQAYTPAPPYSPSGVPNTGFAFRLLVALTRDGRWLQFSQTSPHLFREFIDALGLTHIWTDPAWAGAPDFPEEAQRLAFWNLLLETAARRTLAEWEAVFAARPNVWAELYRQTAEALDHPQLRHDGRVVDVVDPEAGATTQIGPIFTLRGTPVPVSPAAPLGRDTAPILDALRTGRWNRGSAPPAGVLPPQAFAGITILELGVWYAAPYGPALLADLGARVIKVEPLGGDPMRHALPVADAAAVKANQGKESVALDLTTARGREIVHHLAARADVALVGFRGGVAERLGVDPDTLRAINPRLVYVAAPGYGTSGPCAVRPAFAPTIGAACGAGLVQAGAVPQSPGLPLAEVRAAAVRLGWASQAPGNADGCAALGVATALALGLVARERTGVAPVVETSMLATAVWAFSEGAIVRGDGRSRPTADPMLFGYGALYRLYETAAGWVFLACPKLREWEALCRGLPGGDVLSSDPRFADPVDRRRHDAALADALAIIFRREPAAVWEARLGALDVACVEVARGPVARAVLEDVVFREAGFLTEVEHATFGRHRRLMPLVHLARTPGACGAAPTLGMHTDTVLAELGYDRAARVGLAAAGIVSPLA